MCLSEGLLLLRAGVAICVACAWWAGTDLLFKRRASGDRVLALQVGRR
jgi:hypothetical protein